MAWLGFELDDTLVQRDPLLGEIVVEGAPEAIAQLIQEGHRITVYTSRFNAMPDEVKQQKKLEMEEMLEAQGFPPVEVWAGTHKPACDFFVARNNIPFDNDWGLALAHLQVEMEDRGLVPGPQPGAAEQSTFTGEEPLDAGTADPTDDSDQP